MTDGGIGKMAVYCMKNWNTMREDMNWMLMNENEMLTLLEYN